MHTYSLLREFADSWFLLAMFGFFLGTWVWAFWPSLKSAREEAASIPFRETTASCGKDCTGCVSKTDFLKEVDHG